MRSIKRSFIGLFILLSLVLVHTINATPLEKFSEKEIQLTNGLSKAKLSVQISAGEISVAESLTLIIEVIKPAGTIAQLPSFSALGFATEFTERSQRFRLTDISPLENETLADGRTLQRQIYTLEPWLSGDYAILPIMVPIFKEEVTDSGVNGGQGGAQGLQLPLLSLMTDGLRITVTPLSDDRRQLSPLFGQADLNQSGLLKKKRRIEDKSDEELRREKEEKNETKIALKEKTFPWWVIWLLLTLLFIIPAGWYLSRKKIKKFFSSLLGCYYCFSHWVAFPISLYFKINLFGGTLGLLITPFVVIWISVLMTMVVDSTFKKLNK